MKQTDTYYNYDVDYLELSLPYIDGNGNVCTVSALYNVDHNILKQNFKENEYDNNPVILSYILHVTDNTYNTHDIEYKLKFKKYPQTVLFADDIDNIKIYNNADAVLNCFSTYCVKNNEIKTHIPTIYNFLDKNGEIIQPKDHLYTQIDNTFSLPEYINGNKVLNTYLLNLNYIKLPFSYRDKNNNQVYTYTYVLLGPTYCHSNNNAYTFKPYDNIDERFLKKIKIEKRNESLKFNVIPTNHYENKLYSYALENVSNICNINNLFKFKINNSYIYLSSYFSCKNYDLGNTYGIISYNITIPGFITKFTKNYLSKKYVIYEGSYNSTHNTYFNGNNTTNTNDQDNKITYITQSLQHIQTNNNKVYKYCLQYNNDPNQRVYAYSSTSYSLPKIITYNDDNSNIYYEYDGKDAYNTYTYYNTCVNKFKIDNVYSINDIKLHDGYRLNGFDKNIIGYITYSFSYITDNILKISYQANENYDEYLNTNLCIINYNLDNTPIYSIYHNDGNNVEFLKKLLLDCFKIYIHYDKSIVLKNITNIFNIKYTYRISELEQKQENYWNSLNIKLYGFERLYEDDFLKILTTKETFNREQSLLTLYDCCIISVSLNTNKNIVSNIYIVIYNILGINEIDDSNKINITNNIIYIEYSELLNLLKSCGIEFKGFNNKNCILLSETHEITYGHVGGTIYNITYQDQDYNKYKTKLYAYFNNELSHYCNVNIGERWDENIVYTNGFDNLIYENFYDVRTYKNNDEYNKYKTKLHKYRDSYDGISFTYNGVPYRNSYTYLTWLCNSNISLSIKSTSYSSKGDFPIQIYESESNRKQFNVEEYTFKYTYTYENVSYNYTYTCLYKCNELNINTPMSMYTGDNIVINTFIYKEISDLTQDEFYKKYIIDDEEVLSTINTFNYIDSIQLQFYRIYLNKIKYNDNIEYILSNDWFLLKKLYKTNKIFKQIIDKDTNTIISEFNEDFIKLTLPELNVNLNRIYNIKTINNINYISNGRMLETLYDNDKNNTNNGKYEIQLNKNCKLNTVILLYKYFQETGNEIYFYYIKNKFYVVVDNLSYIKDIIVEYTDEKNPDQTKTMIFRSVIKNDNTIKGLYQLIPMWRQVVNDKEPVAPDANMGSTSTGNTETDKPPVITYPTIAKLRMYFINNPIPSENDNVILVNGFDDITENWGKIIGINYSNTKNINIIPLLYNEYDNGLSDDDKQLLLDAIDETSHSNRYDNAFPGGKVEIII